MSTDNTCFIGIDVGTGSARAAVFSSTGQRLGVRSRAIQMWKPEHDHVEQSSDDIWSAICESVRAAMEQAGVAPDRIGGLGFDATCSLVALDANDRPVTVSVTGRDEQNVIVWMDHRAAGEAEAINAKGHDVLRYVGGRISPEMQTPKLAWLKTHLPETWRRTARFLDLPDFLTFRATGDDTRSLCTTVCKWTYLGHEDGEGDGDSIGRWDASYFQQVGLDDLAAEGFRRIGTRVRPMGEAVGDGLTPAAAAELGLVPGTPVGVSIIDAHAGGLGVLGTTVDGAGLDEATCDARIALIGGTSSCHMAVSREPRFVPGVWGPYFSAMVPSLWLTEGGQSATGALIDHVIFSHARAADLQDQAKRDHTSIYDLLNQRLDHLAASVRHPARLTADLHVQPDFHGNRSPRADASLRGMISGLTLDDSVDSLALLYLATIQAVAHGTRHILAALGEQGYRIDTIFACGGGTKNPVFLREHADITGCRIVLPREQDAVLLGSAVLGAVAGGAHPDIPAAMAAMTAADRFIEPDPAVQAYHDAKHAVFLQMHDDQLRYRQLMGD